MRSYLVTIDEKKLTDQEIELLAQQMEAETEFIPIEEARKLGHQLIDKWFKELQEQNNKNL